MPLDPKAFTFEKVPDFVKPSRCLFWNQRNKPGKVKKNERKFLDDVNYKLNMVVG